MSTHILCFEQKYEKYLIFLPENFYFLMVRFSVYLNRRVFVMISLYRNFEYAEFDTLEPLYKMVIYKTVWNIRGGH